MQDPLYSDGLQCGCLVPMAAGRYSSILKVQPLSTLKTLAFSFSPSPAAIRGLR